MIYWRPFLLSLCIWSTDCPSMQAVVHLTCFGTGKYFKSRCASDLSCTTFRLDAEREYQVNIAWSRIAEIIQVGFRSVRLRAVNRLLLPIGLKLRYSMNLFNRGTANYTTIVQYQFNSNFFINAYITYLYFCICMYTFKCEQTRTTLSTFINIHRLFILLLIC